MESKHWIRDRKERNDLINSIGYGAIIKEKIVDRGHKNGAEVHKVTDTGLILIYNQISGKFITALIARVNQIKRYYSEDEVIPERVLALAREHTLKGYNK